ncbi:MAG: FtsQ-type POTRA domain-containing protein [Calditrichaeota bacterium]|nr:FtsQ-type POTRA domain-containing protein [Calditrichota bacterium]
MAGHTGKQSSEAILVGHPPKRSESSRRQAGPPVAQQTAGWMRVLWSILGLTLFVLFLWGLHSWMIHSNAFLLQTIDVRGNRILDKADILKNVSFRRQTRLTDVQLSAIEKKILKNPYLKTVIVYRKYPSTLEIEVEERTPVAYVAGKRVWMIDDEGVLLPKLTGKKALALPVITHSGPFREKAGVRTKNPRLHRTVWFLSMLKALDKNLFYKINSVDYTAQKGMVVYLTEHAFPFYFGNDLDIRQIEYMKAILGKLKQERRVANVRYVDLRFANQVVVK